MKIYVDKLKHHLDLQIKHLAWLRWQAAHTPASRSQFWLAPDSMFLSADPSTISELFSGDPGLPTAAAAPSPTHQDDGDESDDDVEGDNEDHIAVEHYIIEEQQLQTFSAINNRLFSEDDSLFNPNKQKNTDAALESQEDQKLVGHEASSDYAVWDTILSAKLSNTSHMVQ